MRGCDGAGLRKRLYDSPLERLLAGDVLARLRARYWPPPDPVFGPLLKHAKDKTELLYIGTIPKALPNLCRGIRLKAS